MYKDQEGEKKGTVMTQIHYVEKILTLFNFSECSPMSTPMDSSVKLMSNIGIPISQLEYFKAISCLMYFMTSTRPDITFVVEKLSRYTNNLSESH